MKISSRTIVLASGWLLAIAVGFLLGRQTSPPPAGAPAAAHSRTPHPSTARGATTVGHHPSAPAKRQGSTVPSTSPRRDRERVLDELGQSLRLSDRLIRTRRILDLAETLSPEQFPDVVAAFRADGISRLRGTEYNILLNAWVNADPIMAAEYVAGDGDSAGERRTVISAWAAIDPVGAGAWIQDREYEGASNDWVVGLVNGMASNDPVSALQFAEDLDPGATRSRSMQAIVPHVLQNGVAHASEWLASIGDEDLRRDTTRHLARELTRLNPGEAGTWVAGMEPGPARDDATAIVAEQWARTDLESARDWISDLPDDTRATAAEGMARHMARLDPESAATWLNSLGPHPGLDKARRTFITETVRSAPQVALENVYTLSKASDQEKMYTHVLKQWSQKNAKSAQTWVAYNSDALPDSVVKRFTPAPKPAQKVKPKKEPKKPDKNKANKQAKRQGKV